MSVNIVTPLYMYMNKIKDILHGILVAFRYCFLKLVELLRCLRFPGDSAKFRIRPLILQHSPNFLSGCSKIFIFSVDLAKSLLSFATLANSLFF